jgi:hypothetical protein
MHKNDWFPDAGLLFQSGEMHIHKCGSFTICILGLECIRNLNLGNNSLLLFHFNNGTMRRLYWIWVRGGFCLDAVPWSGLQVPPISHPPPSQLGIELRILCLGLYHLSCASNPFYFFIIFQTECGALWPRGRLIVIFLPMPSV